MFNLTSFVAFKYDDRCKKYNQIMEWRVYLYLNFLQGRFYGPVRKSTPTNLIKKILLLSIDY